MNNQDKQQLLERAILDYPAGTKFLPAHIKDNKNQYCIINEGCYFEEIEGKIYSMLPDGMPCSFNYEAGNTSFNRVVYNGSRWAEILSKPEQTPETKYGEVADDEPKMLSDYRKEISVPEEAPQPIDIEKDKRYLDLLDKYTDEKTHYVSWKSLERSTSTKWPVKELQLSVQLSAQRKYFELLLSEKSAEYDYWINKKNKQQDEDIKREREANATIAQQKAEIEQLKPYLKQVLLNSVVGSNEYKKAYQLSQELNKK